MINRDLLLNLKLNLMIIMSPLNLRRINKIYLSCIIQLHIMFNKIMNLLF